MNWMPIEGTWWKHLRAEVKSRWGKLTDDDLDVIGGKFDGLVEKIVERYGTKKETAHKEVTEWAERLRTRVEAVGKSWRDGDHHRVDRTHH